ncbi:hypothetical protein LCI18_011017 [Fusarium solani-melongenae]|uniref:Uncharacterized protein n=1 Tax=Fusarium solani subsp. cucurbitae TaxID=2747967 RepID=A0ACD3ZFT9_FUSSC|nr:hypothetical protein LCI18_011017 [Fusarium solani-melongenae]
MATSPRPSGAESSWISKWYTSQATVKPTSITTQLCEQCITTLKLVHKHLLSRMDLSKPAVRCYDRALCSFILWLDGYEVLKGDLDQVVADSWTLRRLILGFLSDISRGLAEGFVPMLGLSDAYGAQVSNLRAVLYEAEATLQEGNKMSPDWDAGPAPESNSDAESDGSDDSRQESMISDSRDFDDLLADLKTDIQCLHDLGPLIESPFIERQKHPEDVAPVSLQITWEAYQPYGDRILQRFPQAQASLVERLARANLDRFRRIQEEKRENLIKQRQHDEAASRISGSVRYRDSALGTSLATGSIYAETLMAYGQSEDLAVRVPPLPEGAKSGVPFECLACGRNVSIKNNSAWKKHLWRDLRPWICHDSACDFGNEPFTSREDWIEHLEFDHNFQLAWGSFECPLCHEETGEGKTAIIHHLASHMEEISLAALPSGYDSDNDLEGSEDEAKNEDTDEDKNGDDDGDDDDCISEGEVSDDFVVLEPPLADGSSAHDPIDQQNAHWHPTDPASGNAREHDLYTHAVPQEDGLYHCPWERRPSCNHQPEKSKAAYDIFVDSHLKLYRCKAASCEGVRFSSTFFLFRHEREIHGMHR